MGVNSFFMNGDKFLKKKEFLSKSKNDTLYVHYKSGQYEFQIVQCIHNSVSFQVKTEVSWYGISCISHLGTLVY